MLRAFIIFVAGRTTILSAPWNTIQSYFSCFAGFDKWAMKKICKTITKSGNCRVFSVSLITMESWKGKNWWCFSSQNSTIYQLKERLIIAKVNWVITSTFNTWIVKYLMYFIWKICSIILLFLVNPYKKTKSKFHIKGLI